MNLLALVNFMETVQLRFRVSTRFFTPLFIFRFFFQFFYVSISMEVY